MPEPINIFRQKLLRHAPAGRPVPRRALRSARRISLEDLWSGAHVELFDSGTAALAVALKRTLINLRAESPRWVALPTYGCPNLLAATLWAGGTPVYYDISPETLAPDASTLKTLLRSSGTVVVHVDAFGAATLDALVRQSAFGLECNGRLVHDLAQSYAPYFAEWQSRAPYSVISTGRAKPMSLTFGGALLSFDGVESPTSSPVGGTSTSTSRLVFALRAKAYGLSMRPIVFGTLSRIPQLGIGQTTFTALSSVRQLSRDWNDTFAAAAAEVREALLTYRADSDSMLQLARECGAHVPLSAVAAGGRLPLWRVPVLCSTPEAARAIAESGNHLGVSRLYGRTIPEIMGMPHEQARAQWPNAVSIAERLVTLPTHGRLTNHALASLQTLLRKAGTGSELRRS
jgi:dTDP-4-amino-4,6-dideoxygalactose transaminase